MQPASRPSKMKSVSGTSQTSPGCAKAEHAACPHAWMFGATLTRGRSQELQALLCSCSCHSGCPLGPAAAVPHDRWQSDCTCPGAEAHRARQSERQQAAADWQERLRAAGGDLRLASGMNSDQVRAELRRALVEQGFRPSSAVLNGLARFLTITRGPRLLVSPRMALFLSGFLLRAMWYVVRHGRLGRSDRPPWMNSPRS